MFHRHCLLVLKAHSSVLCFIQLPLSCMKSQAALKEKRAWKMQTLLGLCTFIYLPWKHEACINACKAKFACKGCASAKVCAGVSVTYCLLVPKVPEISITLRLESMNHNDLLKLWHGRALALPFFLLFFFFFPPLKNVTKPQWLSSPVIEILTKTSSHICDSKTGSMLHNSGPLMAWFAYTANAYSFFSCFWSLENKHLSIAVGICSESSIFRPFFNIWRLCYRLLLQE